MPEPISCRPLQEFNLCNGFGPQPHAFLHLLSGEFIAPTRLVRVRQVSEGHDGRHKMTDFLENLTPRRGNEAIANASDIDQIVAAIIADDQRIKSVLPRNVPADHKL